MILTRADRLEQLSVLTVITCERDGDARLAVLNKREMICGVRERLRAREDVVDKKHVRRPAGVKRAAAWEARGRSCSSAESLPVMQMFGPDHGGGRQRKLRWGTFCYCISEETAVRRFNDEGDHFPLRAHLRGLNRFFHLDQHKLNNLRS